MVSECRFRGWTFGMCTTIVLSERVSETDAYTGYEFTGVRTRSVSSEVCGSATLLATWPSVELLG